MVKANFFSRTKYLILNSASETSALLSVQAAHSYLGGNPPTGSVVAEQLVPGGQLALHYPSSQESRVFCCGSSPAVKSNITVILLC